jgi:ATP-binding cassette subfamily C protein
MAKDNAGSTGRRPEPALNSARGVANNINILRQLRAFARKFVQSTERSALTAAVLLVLLAGATEGVGLALLVPLIGLLGEPANESGILATVARRGLEKVGLSLSIPAVVIVFVGVVIARSVILGMRDVRLEQLQLQFTNSLRGHTYRAVAGASWSFLMRRRLSDILEVLTSQIDRISHGIHFFLRLPALAVVAAVQIGVALALSPLLTLAVLSWGIALLLLFRRRFHNRYVEGQNLVVAHRLAFGEISDFLQALKLAKSHNAERRHIAAFETAAARQTVQALVFERSAVIARMMIQIAAAVTLGLFVYLGVTYFQLSASEVLVMIVVFTRLAPMISELQQGWQTIAHTLPIFDSVVDLCAQCTSAGEPTADAVSEFRVAREIRFSGVSFHYEESEGPAAVEALDLVIPSGSIVAIVGPTGAGKTTLADLLLGLIVPQNGTITVDGVPLEESTRASWRRSVGYVPQENFLFNDTVRANLTWARPEANQEDIEWALSTAAADKFVNALPKGLDTPIGERGIRLSGGERQRLGLARALLRRPTLLVLDEATSALDQRTEKIVQSAVQRLRGSMTIVIIAHRVSTIRSADRIFMLERGRLVQEGTWDALTRDGHSPFAALLGMV